jgi:hypothetical protein
MIFPKKSAAFWDHALMHRAMSRNVGESKTLVSANLALDGVRPQKAARVKPGNCHAAEIGSQLLDETLINL